jgi:hypothetical protein
MTYFLTTPKNGAAGCNLTGVQTVDEQLLATAARCRFSGASPTSAPRAVGRHYSIEVALYIVDAVTRNVAKEAYAFNLGQPPGKEPRRFRPPKWTARCCRSSSSRRPRKCRILRRRPTRASAASASGSTHDTKLADASYGICFGGVLESGLMMAATCVQSGMNPAPPIHSVGNGVT